MKIPLDLIPNAYNISKQVYEGKLTLSEGTKLLVGNDRMNESSARDYIYDFRYLKQGKKFSRTLNADSMNYFFENLLKDYGVSELFNPLSALQQHIEYYEKKQKTTMHLMREIYNKYSGLAVGPTLIKKKEQLIHNIETIENFLIDGSDVERAAASKLIKNGICFVAYKVGNEWRFAPSKFLGYEGNVLFKYPVRNNDGRQTNKAIIGILKVLPASNDKLEQKYIDYCNKLGIKPLLKGGTYGKRRKYWTLNLEHDFTSNKELTGEFPEGKIVERTHNARERSSKVIDLAKHNFKVNHGKLFCQVCGFDFEARYGETGKDYIEGHHTIAVSDMPPEYKTKPEEIAMLCANCHRMAHKRRPWLTMEQLSMLIIPE